MKNPITKNNFNKNCPFNPKP